MISPWTGDPATEEAGLLAPFRARQGRRVIDAGCGTGDVSGALAERGLDVVALESDPTLGSLAARRLKTHPDATFEALSLKAWSDAHPDEVGTIDLLFLRRRVGASADPASASELAGDLERADRLLGPAGVVIIAIEPDRGSGHDPLVRRHQLHMGIKTR